MISQDDYFLTKDKVPRVPKSDNTDLFYQYDCAEAMDAVGLAKGIQAAKEKHDYVVVEGNMLCQMPEVLKLLERVIFVTLDEETCRERREKRTDYDPADVHG